MTSEQEASRLFSQGFELHQKGNLAEATAIYERILSTHPGNFEVLQLLGVIAAQTKNFTRAVELLTQALQSNPHHAATYNNRGIAYKELGQLTAAIADYDRAIAIKPDYADACHNRGNAFKALKQMEAAVASYNQAIAIKPDYAAAFYNRGIALMELKQPDAAMVSYDQAITLKPDYAEAYNNRGNAFKDLHRLDAAIADYGRAVAIKPDYADAWYNRGIALMERGQLEAAIADFDRTLAIRPDFAEAFNNRGNALKGLKQLDAALASYELALAARPDSAETHINRGIVLKELGQLKAAIASHDQALAISPDNAEAYYNRGNALKDLGQLDAAVASYDKAIALKPEYGDAYNNRGVALQSLMQLEAAADSYERAIRIQENIETAHWNLCICNLLRGNFAQGWPGYEARWENNIISTIHQRNFPQPLWLGEDEDKAPDGSLAGKTILLHWEQGLGDTLQFCRYARLVAALGAKVILEVQPPLMKLLADLEGVSQLIAGGSKLPPFDYQCPLMSLPLAFKTDLQTIPAPASYLHSDPQKVAQWQERCGPRTKPRIGLVWSGYGGHKNDFNRSIALDELAPLLKANSNCEFFSLQQEVRESDRAALQAHPNLRHFGAELAEFSDTAALCDLMDLVICVDTSVAHLAGAMGKPLWILLPFSPDWRWLEDRTDSPWYPSARLYRQESIGDWTSVIARVCVDLANLTST